MTRTGCGGISPSRRAGSRQAFNSLCQGTGADHLRWLMNNVDQEVCSRPEFAACRLVLTMHDSLVYEAPEGRWKAFVKAALPVVSRRPPWATIDMKIDIEHGPKFGELTKLEPQ